MEYASPSAFGNYYSYPVTSTNSSVWVWFIIGIFILIVFFGMWWVSNNNHRSYYRHDNPVINNVRENFAKINQEYAQIPIREGDSSYTEGKKFITLCLKNPETGEYYDMNTIMYVALHELAHLISESYGSPGNEHNQEFRSNFSLLLERAERLGFYNPRIPMPRTYCGVDH